MKKVLLVLVSVLWLGAMVSFPVKADEAAQEAETNELNQIMMSKDKLEAKEIPDDSANVTITYESGAPVFVIGETTDGWYKVSYQDKVGYVHKSALTSPELDVEGLDKEMKEAEEESKLVVEEVERYRAEARRSRIWGTIIVLLVVGIFATGIISTLKTEKEKNKEASRNDSGETDSGEADGCNDSSETDNSETDNGEMDYHEMNIAEVEAGQPQAEEITGTETDDEIIDLDKEE